LRNEDFNRNKEPSFLKHLMFHIECILFSTQDRSRFHNVRKRMMSTFVTFKTQIDKSAPLFRNKLT